MNLEKFCENEGSRLQKILSFQLPHNFKKIGLFLVILCFLGLTAIKFSATEFLELREILRKIFLLSLLLVSLSRDEIDDELVMQLRASSYSMAFIFGIIYAIVQPYINLLVERTTSFDLGGFQILTFMLLIQLGFFHFLKRMR